MITFADVPLLLEDPQEIARTFLDQFLDEAIASIFSPNAVQIVENRQASRVTSSTGTVARVGLPVPNYPPGPKPKLNTLYWPTGANRFAYGLFLIDGKNLDTIVDTVGDQNEVQTFEMGNFESSSSSSSSPPSSSSSSSSSNPRTQCNRPNKVRTDMYLLPPRPVSPPGVPDDDKLWILPLVDERYFWKDRQFESFSPGSWDDLFDEIGSVLGNTVNFDAVDAGYAVPNQAEWNVDGENVAILLDAACHSTGMRFVRLWDMELDSQYYCDSFETAIDDYEDVQDCFSDETTKGWEIVAGGDFSLKAYGSIYPKTVSVAFKSADGGSFSGFKTVDASGSIYEPLSVKQYFASMQYTDAGSTALADAVAEDFYGWLNKFYDYTFAGIVPWMPTGLDDFILWEFGVEKRGQLVATTRVQTMSYNFGTSNLPVGEFSSSSSADAGGGSCCGGIECISVDEAIAGGCDAVPDGAAYQFQIDIGDWEGYETFVPDGKITVTYGVPFDCDDEPSSSSSSSSDDGCMWYSCVYCVEQPSDSSSSSSSAVTGCYQFQFHVFTDSDGYPDFKCVPVFISGTDWISAAYPGFAETI